MTDKANDRQHTRDEVAIAAMQGLLSNEQSKPVGMSFDVDHLARQAYRIADAMLRARGDDGQK